ASMQIKDIQNVFKADREVIYEAQNRIRNELRWYRVSLQPLHDESGNVKQVLVNATDIHDLMTIQQELQELNQTLEEKVTQRTAEVRDLYENAPTGYHSLDADGHFVMVNQTELNWLGYTREELIERPFLDILTPESLEKFKTKFPEFIKRGWLIDAEFDLIRKDGSILPVSLNATAIRDKNGQFLMSRSTIFDITERKKAETALRLSRDQLHLANAALQKASQTKIEFLANMSHELRTPLNGILGMSEILLDEIRGSLNERQRRMVGVIESSGRHLLSLINDILDLSKVEAGKVELHLEPIAVLDLCNACLSFIRGPAVKKGITLEFEPDPQVVTITVDLRRFKQVLINLLSNAVKFTGDNGRVTLKVRQNKEQQRIEFSVTDTGIGISREDLSRLFNPFTQVDSSLTREHEGTGLGLALVHELMQLHGGGVYVESEVGKGSTLRFPSHCKEKTAWSTQRRTQNNPMGPNLERTNCNRRHW
ncbi:MAG: PAS domain S-box protein, partial [Chloroflexi bacterium]|nr:PAS domain S-box protein [Chloroflexota bacterium]